MLFLPELKLKKICDTLLNYLKEDIKEAINNNEENKSYLYLLFHEDSLDTNMSVYYNQAKEIFLRKEENSRYLKVSPIFDRNRAGLPTIHIMVPQDSESILQLGDTEGGFYKERGTDKLERGFKTQFQFVITSDNILEVYLIIYIIRALLIGSTPDLAAVGFIDPSFSTQDLNIRQDVLPANVYMKGILMAASYSESFPETGKINSSSKVIFNLTEINYK